MAQGGEFAATPNCPWQLMCDGGVWGGTASSPPNLACFGAFLSWPEPGPGNRAVNRPCLSGCIRDTALLGWSAALHAGVAVRPEMVDRIEDQPSGAAQGRPMIRGWYSQANWPPPLFGGCSDLVACQVISQGTGHVLVKQDA